MHSGGDSAIKGVLCFKSRCVKCQVGMNQNTAWTLRSQSLMVTEPGTEFSTDGPAVGTKPVHFHSFLGKLKHHS